MNLSLPDSIATYFAVSNGADRALLVRCFARDAVVFDEGRTHRGHEAIQSWLRETQEKFEYRVEPLDASQEGDYVTVAANVIGNFPGSPARLNHVFELVGGRIRSLRIG